MAQGKKTPPVTPPLHYVWDRVCRFGKVGLEKQDETTLTLYVDTGSLGYNDKQSIADMLYTLRKTKPNAIQGHIRCKGGKVDLLALWRKNEILPTRLYFEMGVGRKCPHKCRLSLYKAGLIETKAARVELKSLGWLDGKTHALYSWEHWQFDSTGYPYLLDYVRED